MKLIIKEHFFDVDHINNIRIRKKVTPATSKYFLTSDMAVSKSKLKQLALKAHGWTSGVDLIYDAQSTKLGKNVVKWTEYNRI